MLRFSMHRMWVLGVLLLVAIYGLPSATIVHAQEVQTSLLRNIPGGWVGRGIAVTPDGQRLYTPSSSTTVSAIDTNTFQELARITVCQNPAGIAITPDGAYIYVASGCGGFPSRVSIIRTSDNVVIKTLNVAMVAWAVVISPDGQFVYVTDDANGSDLVTVIRTSDNTVVGYYSGVGNRSRGIAITPDGRYIYVTSFASSTISVIDTSVGHVVKTISISGGSLAGVSITPDGQYAYVANGTQVVVIRTSDHSVYTTIPLSSSASAIAFTPDGKYAYIGAGLLYVVRTSDYTILETLDTTGAGSWNDFAALMVSPTMNHVYVTNSIDGIISIFTHTSTYSISGRVTDVNNIPHIPISDVIISDGVGHTTTTDTNGNYTLSGLMVGTYTLTASKSGYMFSSSSPITVPPNATGVNFTAERLLNVPLFKQGIFPFDDNNPPWEDLTYDHADVQTLDCGTTLAACGCATTSIAMVLAFYGITHAPIASPVALETNPDTVNRYFQRDPRSIKDCDGDPNTKDPGIISRGYVCGGVNWYTVAQYSRDAYQLYGTQELAFNGASTYNMDTVRQDINANSPVIIRVPGPQHWVVATGITGGTFTINDPFHTRTRLDDAAYNNTGLEMRRYVRTASDFSAIVIGAVAPTQVLITNANGNRTGFDPNTSSVVTEIPNSTYFFEPALADDTGEKPPPPASRGNYWVIVNTPQGGVYNIEVTASPNPSYTLAAYTYDHDANFSLNPFEGHSIAGVRNRYTFTYNPTPGAPTFTFQASIDIWPFLQKNIVVTGKNYPIPVAILSTNTFSAINNINTTSLTFGRTGDEKTLTRCLPQALDVNRDGLKDLICIFRNGSTGFKAGDTEGVLKGFTLDGSPIEGRDSIQTIPLKEPSLFTAQLSGKSEVPPVVSKATGTGLFTLNTAKTELNLTLVNNLKNITAVDISCAPAGVNGAVGVTLFSGGPVTQPLFKGKITTPDVGNACGWTDLATVLTALQSGDTYINMHTLAYPSGEIRGQINAGIAAADVVQKEGGETELNNRVYLPLVSSSE